MKLRMAGYQDARSVHTRAIRVLEASLKQSLGASCSFLKFGAAS